MHTKCAYLDKITFCFVAHMMKCTNGYKTVPPVYAAFYHVILYGLYESEIHKHVHTKCAYVDKITFLVVALMAKCTNGYKTVPAAIDGPSEVDR